MEIWTVALGIGAIAIPALVTILIYRRQSPKRALWWSYETDPLTPTASTALSGRLEVVLDGVAVSEAHFLRLSFWSTGKADVPSDSFDSGQPVVFSSSVPIIGPSEPPVIVGLDPSAVSIVGQEIRVNPTLLRRDCAVDIRVITSGSADVVERSSIVDVGLRKAAETQDRRARMRTMQLAVIVAVLGLYAMIGAAVVILAPVLDSLQTNSDVPPLGWVLFGLAFALAGVAYFLVIRSVIRQFASGGRAKAQLTRRLLDEE